MIASEFGSRFLAWANRRRDIEAVILIGSRAQASGAVDIWSDWDYHIISRNSHDLKNGKWLSEIGPCWNTHIEYTPRKVTKLSCVFEGGVEADFIPLESSAMKLMYWAMARPQMRRVYPAWLVDNIRNAQLVLRPGYKVLIGGAEWERRLLAIETPWPFTTFAEPEYQFHVAGFWRHAVWVGKKIIRGETRAAQRWFHISLAEHVWAILLEEASSERRPSRPEARRAEHWLSDIRLRETEYPTSADQATLAQALLAQISLFEDASRKISEKRNYALPNYSTLSEWLSSQLLSVAQRPAANLLPPEK